MGLPLLCFSDGFHGDVYLTVKLLLPGVIKSVYNLNDKQIVKLFSRIFNCNPDDMARDLEQVRHGCREVIT
jgi:DNA ligase-3